MEWKRMALNIMGLLVILVGGMALTSSTAAAGPVLLFDRCTTDSGGVCEGATCCSNGKMCSTDKEICKEMLEEEEEKS